MVVKNGQFGFCLSAVLLFELLPEHFTPSLPPTARAPLYGYAKNALFICKSIKGNIYSRSVDDAIDYTPAAQWGKGEPRGWGRRARGVERFWIFSYFFWSFFPCCVNDSM